MNGNGNRASIRDGAATALGTYLAPLATSRALKIGFLLVLAFLALVGLALILKPFSGVLSAESLERLRRGAVLPGVPLASLLLAEIPIRDGIRHRTLLYPLLGPASRPVLAWVRTAATALLTGAGLALLVLAATVAGGGDRSLLGRELASVFLGSAAYVALFGIIHLITRRGLIAGLAIYALVDDPLSRLPFTLHNLSPAFHLRVLADQVTEIRLPVELTAPPTSVPGSAITLAAIALLLTALAAFLFSRKQLGEIC